MNNLELSSPWASYAHKLMAMFEPDPDITINYDNDKNTVHMYVCGNKKADALEALLPASIAFGNVLLTVIVHPANITLSKEDMLRDALEGNPLFSRVITVAPEGSSNKFNYVMFKNQAVQYWDDNLGDPHGNVTTLAQNLLPEVLNKVIDFGGIFFCTEEPDEE